MAFDEFLSDIRDFDVFVDADLWEEAQAGYDEAKEELRNNIDGLVVYFHAFHPEPNHIPVSIDDLIKYDIVNSLTLHKDIA